ncbi:hypothetical protein QSE00_23700 [Arenibacter sp. M-2]|uniref:hypothetical protein n=1 Tax=Arenibacter sp. M-2 TaxID=3053612 RepID=UPI00256FADA9|nr:hypothetical protein [Arenibacter sp. M-2]MDL5514835.1 hypothetical protein [Arenibacter sp. M-2]
MANPLNNAEIGLFAQGRSEDLDPKTYLAIPNFYGDISLLSMRTHYTGLFHLVVKYHMKDKKIGIKSIANGIIRTSWSKVPTRPCHSRFRRTIGITLPKWIPPNMLIM